MYLKSHSVPANNESGLLSKVKKIPMMLFLLLGIAIVYSLSSIPEFSAFQTLEVSSKNHLCSSLEKVADIQRKCIDKKSTRFESA